MYMLCGTTEIFAMTFAVKIHGHHIRIAPNFADPLNSGFIYSKVSVLLGSVLHLAD